MRLLLKAVAAIVVLGVQLPISLWLQYQVLKRVEATELMMFLFWANVPIIIVTSLIAKLIEDKSKGEN